MALENYRITEFQEKTQVDNGDYVLIDSATDGTHKYQLSRIPAQASAEVAAAVAAEETAREAADAAEVTARNAAIGAAISEEVTARNAAIAANVDDTLAVSGKAADAKKTGDEIADVKSDLTQISEYADMKVRLVDQSNWVKENGYFAVSQLTGNVSIASSVTAMYAYFPCEKNTTYLIEKMASQRFRVGYTETKPEVGVLISGYNSNDTGNSLQVTTGASARYVVIYYYSSTADTLAEASIFNTIYVSGLYLTAKDQIARNALIELQDYVDNVRENIGQIFTDEAKQTLIAILKEATYLSDAEELIEELEEALVSGVITVGPSGVITVTNAKSGVPISLIMDVVPVQNLHGYDYPWTAGNGKNKAPYIPNGTNNGVTFSVDSEGIVHASGTATAGLINMGNSFTIEKDCVYYGSGSPSDGTGTYGLTLRYTDNGVPNDGGLIFGTCDFNNGEVGRIAPIINQEVKFGIRFSSGATVPASSSWTPMLALAGRNNYMKSKFSGGSKGGLTFTIDSNGALTVNGTCSESVFYGVNLTLPKGNYIVAGNRHITMALYDSESSMVKMSNVEGFTGNDTFSHRGGEFTLAENKTMWLAYEVVAGTYNNRKVYPVICDLVEPNYTQYTPYTNICPFTQINSIAMKHGASASDYQTESFDVSSNNYYGGVIDFVARTLKKAAYYASYAGETLRGEWQSSMDKYEAGGTPTTGAAVIDFGSLTDTGISVNQVSLLSGNNRLSTDDGLLTLTYERN